MTVCETAVLCKPRHFIHITILRVEKRICLEVMCVYVSVCVYTSLRGPGNEEEEGSEKRKQRGKLKEECVYLKETSNQWPKEQ